MRGARRGRWTICFDSVPGDPDVQRDAKRAFCLFRGNPAHPGLQFKKLEGEDNIYSARIGLEYRALAVMKKDRIVWYWIGSHAEYDRLV
jgi:hypothetical protein